MYKLIWLSIVIFTACSSKQKEKATALAPPQIAARDSVQPAIGKATAQQNVLIDSPGYIDKFYGVRQELNKKYTTKNGNYHMIVPFSDDAVKIAWGNDTVKRIYNKPLDFFSAEKLGIGELESQHYMILGYITGSDWWQTIVLPLNNYEDVLEVENGMRFDAKDDLLVIEAGTFETTSGGDTVLEVINLRTRQRQFILEKNHCSSAINHHCIDSITLNDGQLYYKWVTPNIFDKDTISERRIKVTI